MKQYGFVKRDLSKKLAGIADPAARSHCSQFSKEYSARLYPTEDEARDVLDRQPVAVQNFFMVTEGAALLNAVDRYLSAHAETDDPWTLQHRRDELREARKACG